MAGNTLNIRGLVKSGVNLITTGYVRAVNLNRPANIGVAQIGGFEDGTLEAGRYDIWFKQNIDEPDVFVIGDVFRLTVHSTEADAQTGSSPIYPPKDLLPVTIAQFDASVINYELQLLINQLPGLPVIRAEDNPRYTNVSSGTVDWIWIIPSDAENDNIHFQLEWSLNPAFPPEQTYRYTTNPADDINNPSVSAGDRQYFAYENIPGDSWRAFPSTGVPSSEYGKRCRFRKTLSNDGIYYWRVRATDNAQR